MKKIAYLSNVTADMVAAKLRRTYEVYTPGGYGAWISDVLNDDSFIYGADVDAVFLILDGTEFYGLTCEETDSKVSLWMNAVSRLADRASAYTFVSTIDFSESQIKSYDERRHRLKWKYGWYNFIQNTADASRSVFVLDLDARIADIGRNSFYSPKMWYMGSMPYSRAGIDAVVDEIGLAMKAAFGPRRKAAVVDLDNTVWGGAAGEDGADGIVLSDHNEGARFYDLQRRLLEMKQRGVILGINSKNNEEDALEAFNHPHMLLKLDDFASTKINWNDKASNIRAMESELNLTEGSFVFIDDNPLERETVKAGCPDVEVLDFPPDAADLPKFMERAYREHFQTLSITAEDTAKTQMYQAEIKRRDAKASSLSLDSYISALEMTADIHKMEDKELERVHQLVNKTNQFNLTTKRYSLKELQSMDADIFTVHTADKFGDNGLVSAAVVKRADGKAVIDTFLMSCRVMGRKLENVVMGCLVSYYRDDYRIMTASYVKTAKNRPVEGLYERLGFELVRNSGESKSYILDLTAGYNQTIPYKSVRFNGREIK